MTVAIAINPGEAASAASTQQTPGPLLSLKAVAIAPPDADVAIMTRIDLQVARGERMALVGPSGTGKTTLLRTINGQIRALAGRVNFGGVDMASLAGTELRQLRRHIGFVAQKHDLVEPLRVHQNVMAGALGRWSNRRALRYLFWPRHDELAECEAALASVGLAHKLHEPTTALSGGEQQRVAIARAIAKRPEVLLCDEPTGSLDYPTGKVVLEALARVNRQLGTFTIVITHNAAIAGMADRVIRISSGEIVEILKNEKKIEPSELSW